MRSLVLVLLVGAGCTDRTEIIVGVATDLQAKGQIDLVRLIASRQGTPIVETEWPLVDVPAGHYELPGSFGLYSADGSETAIEISVKGYKSNNLVAERDSQLSLVSGKTLFMRMTLTAACSPTVRPACKGDESCGEGVCQKRAIDARRLPKYRPELVTSTECTGSVNYIVSSTGAPMAKLADTCPAGDECHEGTCWAPPPGSTPSFCVTLDAGVPDGGYELFTPTDLRIADFPIYVALICGTHFFPYELTINAGGSLSFIGGDGNSHHIMSSFVTTPDIKTNASSMGFPDTGDFTVSCTDHPSDGQLLVHSVP